MKETSRVGDSRARDIPDMHALDRNLTSFRDLLLSQPRADALLQGLANQVVAAIPVADMAGVTVLDETSRTPKTTACTDERVLAVEADQYRSDQGPSLDASRTGTAVRARLSDLTVRWPRFAAQAADIGIRNYLSIPITMDRVSGSVNVYSASDQSFTDADEVLVKVFVAAVEAAVSSARTAQETQSELDGLREAMRSRATIEQAKGIVMAIRGIAADDAFEVLSLQSQNENVKVASIAQRIVESVGREG